MSVKLKDLLWVGLKLALLLTLLLVLVGSLWLVFQGKDLNRRAAGGLIVLPMFMVFYAIQFQQIQLTAWSVISHLGVIGSLITVGVCIWLIKTHQVEDMTSLVIVLVALQILIFTVAFCGVVHFAGIPFIAKKKIQQ